MGHLLRKCCQPFKNVWARELDLSYIVTKGGIGDVLCTMNGNTLTISKQITHRVEKSNDWSCGSYSIICLSMQNGTHVAHDLTKLLIHSSRSKLTLRHFRKFSHMFV